MYKTKYKVTIKSCSLTYRFIVFKYVILILRKDETF